jgi:hypothetical protein
MGRHAVFFLPVLCGSLLSVSTISEFSIHSGSPFRGGQCPLSEEDSVTASCPRCKAHSLTHYRGSPQSEWRWRRAGRPRTAPRRAVVVGHPERAIPTRGASCAWCFAVSCSHVVPSELPDSTQEERTPPPDCKPLRWRPRAQCAPGARERQARRTRRSKHTCLQPAAAGAGLASDTGALPCWVHRGRQERTGGGTAPVAAESVAIRGRPIWVPALNAAQLSACRMAALSAWAPAAERRTA